MAGAEGRRGWRALRRMGWTRAARGRGSLTLLRNWAIGRRDRAAPVHAYPHLRMAYRHAASAVTTPLPTGKSAQTVRDVLKVLGAPKVAAQAGQGLFVSPLHRRPATAFSPRRRPPARARKSPAQPAMRSAAVRRCSGVVTLAAAPLGPLIELLDRLPPSVSQAVRSGRATPEVLAGMLVMLRDRTRPAVLVIDDVHWADSATLDLLR